MVEIIDDLKYQQCCGIADKLEELDSKILSQLLICIFANFPETRDYVLNLHYDIVDENEGSG